MTTTTGNCSKSELRAVIRFEMIKGNPPPDIHRKLVPFMVKDVINKKTSKPAAKYA